MSRKISFAPLGNLLESQHLKWFYLREQGISPGILNKLRHGKGHIDTRTIERICSILDCQPGEIMEYIPDSVDSINEEVEKNEI